MPTVPLRIKSVISMPSFRTSVTFSRFFVTLGALVNSKALDGPYLISSESHPLPKAVNIE